MEDYTLYAEQLADCVRYLKEAAKLKDGSVVVLGLSTSEVAGGRIGHNSIPELGEALAVAMIDTCRELKLYPVFQCCEHLNRSLVMEQELLDRLRLIQVNVMPVPNAGGSCGAGAYKHMICPAMAMAIQADAAIDVGDTLVGMHLRPVAVPLRMENKDPKVGNAHVVMAYSRLPFVGGYRAQYPERIR